MSPIRKGAALEFTEIDLGGPVVEQESFPVCQLTVTDIAPGNGDRVGLVIMNLGANPVYISLSPSVGPAAGLLLSANGGLTTMAVRDDFTLPSRAWKMISTGGTSQMYILELIRFSATQKAGA